MKRPARVTVSFAFAAFMALAAAGCTPAAPVAPTTAPTGASPAAPAPTPSVTAQETLAAAPTPRFDLTCDDLLGASDLGKLFADKVSAVDPAIAELGATDNIPYSYYVRARGGLDCAWSNGKTDDGSGTRTAMTATISILPDAAAGWKRYKNLYKTKSDTQAYCSGDATITSCYLDALSHGYWIAADFENINAKLKKDTSPLVAPAKAPITTALASLGTLGTLRPLWTPPSGTATAPASCDGYVSTAEITKALGTSAKIVLGAGDNGGWSLGAEAESTASHLGCIFGISDSDNGYGYLTWLPGGAWAATETAKYAPGTPITVAGLKTGDSATTWTDPVSHDINVDLVVGGNWAHFTLWDYGSASDIPKAKQPRAVAARTIAADIVARLEG